MAEVRNSALGRATTIGSAAHHSWPLMSKSLVLVRKKFVASPSKLFLQKFSPGNVSYLRKANIFWNSEIVPEFIVTRTSKTRRQRGRLEPRASLSTSTSSRRHFRRRHL